MASFWDGLLGGSDPSALYGDVFTPEQKKALQWRQMSDTLGELAGGFGRAAMPSPVRLGLGAVLGTAAGGLGNSDQAVDRALVGSERAEKIKQARRQAEWYKKFGPLIDEAYRKSLMEGGVPGAPGAVPPAVPPGMTPPPGVPPIAPQEPPGVPPPPGTPPESLPGIRDLGQGLLASGRLPGGISPGTAAGLPPEIYSLLSGTSGPGAALPPEAAPPASAGPGGDWGITGPGLLPPGQQTRPGAPGVPGSPTAPLPGDSPAELQRKARLRQQDPYLGLGPNGGLPAGPVKQTGLLPPPDQYIPQGGSGILSGGVMPASYGGPATAPRPFRQASAAGPGAGGADAGNSRDPRGLIPFIRQTAEKYNIDPDVAVRVAQSEGLTGFRSSVIQRNGEREPSYGAFQLYTGGGMGNDFQRDTGLDPSNPKNELATIDYALSRVPKTGWTPFHGAKNVGIGARTGLPGGEDYVIPSGGPRLSRDMLMNAQYTPNAPGAQYVPPGGGLNDPIPGLGMSPKQISLLDAMAEMAGIKTPFKELLDSYYKTPGYLGEAKRAQEQVELQFAAPKAEATAAATQKYIQENQSHQSALDLAKDLIGRGVYFDKATGTMKPITNAAEAFAAIDNAKQTGDIKEYNFYAQQTTASGGIPKPFEVWDRERKKAGAMSVNTVPGLEQAQTTARIEIDKAVALEANKKAFIANESLPLIDEMMRIADKTPEGWAGPIAKNLAGAFSALGIPLTEGMTNAEAMVALSQRMIPPIRDPGSSSDKDMQLYLGAVPGLGQSAEGRIKVATMMKAIIQRSIETADIYHETIGVPTAERRARINELNNKPLFTEEQRKTLEEARQRQSGQQPATQGSTAAPLDKASYDRLPSGAVFTAPDGSRRVKP